MLFGKEEPKISTTQRTTPRTTEMSLKKRREEQYLKAQQKLLQLQRLFHIFQNLTSDLTPQSKTDQVLFNTRFLFQGAGHQDQGPAEPVEADADGDCQAEGAGGEEEEEGAGADEERGGEGGKEKTGRRRRVKKKVRICEKRQRRLDESNQQKSISDPVFKHQL